MTADQHGEPPRRETEPGRARSRRRRHRAPKPPLEQMPRHLHRRMVLLVLMAIAGVLLALMVFTPSGTQPG